MNEKHLLFHRETLDSEPQEQGEFPTYLSAIQVGQKLGFGTWWVESKHFVNNRFEAFAPELPEEDVSKRRIRAKAPGFKTESGGNDRFLHRLIL